MKSLLKENIVGNLIWYWGVMDMYIEVSGLQKGCWIKEIGMHAELQPCKDLPSCFECCDSIQVVEDSAIKILHKGHNIILRYLAKM